MTKTKRSTELVHSSCSVVKVEAVKRLSSIFRGDWQVFTWTQGFDTECIFVWPSVNMNKSYIFLQCKSHRWWVGQVKYRRSRIAVTLGLFEILHNISCTTVIQFTHKTSTFLEHPLLSRGSHLTFTKSHWIKYENIPGSDLVNMCVEIIVITSGPISYDINKTLTHAYFLIYNICTMAKTSPSKLTQHQ